MYLCPWIAALNNVICPVRFMAERKSLFKVTCRLYFLPEVFIFQLVSFVNLKSRSDPLLGLKLGS